MLVNLSAGSDISSLAEGNRVDKYVLTGEMRAASLYSSVRTTRRANKTAFFLFRRFCTNLNSNESRLRPTRAMPENKTQRTE